MATQAISVGDLPHYELNRNKGARPGAQSGCPLIAIAPGPRHVLRTSVASSWQSILLERDFYSPGERKSASLNKHVVSMFQGAPSRFEYRKASGESSTTFARPKSMMLSPAGPVPDIRLHTSAELTHCALDVDFIRNVSEELERDAVEPQFHPVLQDEPMQRIIRMLEDELEAEWPAGRLYVDSLVHALATRYLLCNARHSGRPPSRVTGLVPRILARVREKIEANLDTDLNLAALAQESGYSRAHFLRMFREATGFTPHQYVLDLRLRRAQEQLKQSSTSIVEVALSCGFSSQSHMTSVFKQHLEVTPATFRRTCCI